MKVLIETEAEDFLEKEKFPVAERKIVKDENEALNAAKKIGFPLSMKIISHKILHKSDVGGVKYPLNSEDEIKKAFNELKKIEGFEGALVQKFIPGQYVLVGLKKTNEFGHVLVFGLGGIFVEVMKDVSYRICPVTNEDIREMMKEIKGYKLLTGFRGSKVVNLKAIEDVLLRTSNLTKKFENIKELDINPLVINEKEAVIVDARIVFE